MEALHDWLFHYNPYTKAWAAFKREDSSDYFNGNHENVIKSKSQTTLQKLIIEYKGNIKKIQKLD